MNSDLVSGLIAALIGGVVGSAITAWSSLALARSKRREEAASALWGYHYALVAFVAKESGPWRDETTALISGDFRSIGEAARLAYPYAGYVSHRARTRLFRETNVEIGYPPYDDPDSSMTVSRSITELAALLEAELEWAFPRRASDRLHALKSLARDRTKRRTDTNGS